ncbi:efflux RND transporter permease subunit [Rhizobiales bacterium L72]|uniref:Efflux RND transporter permease subunit n=1 Tax=Propylenella binzhouense TaxID=2555902 RepID=A0A964T756_9HYPH|nr:efflux RND transporter permease subunit [Propylenella binzhouense]
MLEATRGISALCVRRPVLTIVANLLIIVAGLAALSAVEIRELPDVDRPVITITADYDGAAPETMDTQVTNILEGAAARVPGVSTISSTSRTGRSRVVVEFNSSVDINVAASDMRDAIGSVERNLPEEVEDLTIVKADDDSDPIIRLAVTAENMPIEDLTKLVDDSVVDRLSAVEGVAQVTVFGDRDPLVRVLVDPDALAMRGISVTDLSNALSSVAMDAPAGNLTGSDQELLVRADASVTSAEEVEAIRINRSTRIGDVADVLFGPAERTSILRINGQTGVGLGIIRQAQSNTLDISEGIQKAVDELNAAMPKGVSVRITSDDATFIGGALNAVMHALGEAVVIVIAVIFLFLRSLRLTIVPAVTVPIALMGTIAAIYLCGFSINILTLLAFVLATGLVVDDAIVVLENIERHMRMGMGPRAAAVLGARQVFFAVISTTATLAAVFIPISFFQGTAGRLFSEFGFVMAFSVVLSAFVALTLCPMLTSRLLKKEDEAHGPSRNPLMRLVGAVGGWSEAAYRRVLDAALAAPMVVLAIGLVFAAGAVAAYSALPEELTPSEDRGMVPIQITGPQGVSIDYMDAQLQELESAARPLLASGEATNMFLIAGRGSTNSGFVVLTLADWDKRARSQQEIMRELNSKLQNIPGVQVFARSPNSLGIRGGGQGLQFAITGIDYDALAVKAEEVRRAMEDSPSFASARLSYDTTQAQLSVRIDRERASDLGVSVDDLGTTLSTLLEGRKMGEFYVGGDAIDVRVEAPTGTINDPTDLESVYVRTSGGRMVPISSFVSVTESAVAPNLPREGQRRAVPLIGQLAEGHDLRSAMAAVEAIAAEKLPPSMGIRFLGEAATLEETSSGMAVTFGFALVVVLLVLAAQFESFVSAVIIMLTVPFGLAAAIYAMVLTGGSLNIYSQIGLVMLVGIMAKNGILIVEFANQLRESGLGVHDAIREACRIRLRPVVMTMVATVIGGVPLVLSHGAGAEARHALGWIVVGGLGLATFVTLFVTPVTFLLLAGLSKPRSAEAERLESEVAAALAGGHGGTRSEVEDVLGPVQPAYREAAE